MRKITRVLSIAMIVGIMGMVACSSSDSGAGDGGRDGASAGGGDAMGTGGGHDAAATGGDAMGFKDGGAVMDAGMKGDGGIACGNKTCAVGQYCCNPACGGQCVPMGAMCTALCVLPLDALF